MIDSFGSALLGSWWTPVVLDVALKATALIVLAFTAHAALGRRRTLVRSALWNACLVGLLLLPPASLMFPRLPIEVPLASEAPPVEATTPARHLPLPEPASMVEALSVTSVPIDVMPPASMRSRAIVEPAPAPLAARPGPRLDAAGLLIGVYLAVAAFLALRLSASLVAVGRLGRTCDPVDEPAWVAAMDRWKANLKIARRVDLSRSDRVSVPIVVGWLRPTIVLPRSLVETATPAIVDAVVLHELGHVRRGDFGWNLVRKLVQLLYWPHPLIWPLGRIIGGVREQACDDLCVHGLGGAADYRASLVEVASGLIVRPDPSLGLAMARATNLGRRLASIDRSRGLSRCLLRWPARLAVALMVISFAGVLGSIELARASAKAVEEPNKPPTDSAEVPNAAEKPKAGPDAPPDAIEVVVLAKETGKPIEGATVRPSLDLVTSERKTDRDGGIRINLSGRRFFTNSFSMDVWAEGFVQQRHSFAQNDVRYPKIPPRVTIALLPGEETLGGKVTDDEGRPLAGVKVEVWGYPGEKKEEHELAYRVDATTDKQGQWRCRCFRSMKFAYLYLSHPDYLSDDGYHPRRHGRIKPSDSPQPGEQPLELLRDFSDMQVMTRGVEISGKVADEQGKPVADAEVGWLEADQGDTFHKDMPKTTTDADGRFRFPHARPGRLVLQVKARGHAPELKQVEAKAGMVPVALKLGPPRTLAGRVVDSKRKPIADVFVVIDTWRNSRALGEYMNTDAEGRFRWEDAPPDSVLINASRTGYGSIVHQSVSPDEGEVVLTLNRSLSISGRIRDSKTDETIDQSKVEVGTPDPKSGEIHWGENPQVFALRGRFQADIDAEKTPEFRLRFKAKGYEPHESRTFRGDEGQVEYDVKLAKSDKPHGVVVSGVVLRPDGKPLEGAEVAVTYGMGRPDRLPVVHIENGKIRPGEIVTTTTDAEGRFSLTREPDPAGKAFGVVVVHPEVFAEVHGPAFEADPTIEARPWGRIEGMASIGGKPAAGVSIRYSTDRLGNADIPYVSDSGETKADDQGRFAIERVVPGDVRVSRKFGEGSALTAWSNGTLIEVRPGETARAEVGGKGRPVIAKIATPDGFDPQADYVTYSDFEIESDRPGIPYPKELVAKGEESLNTWVSRWWASPEGREYSRTCYRFGQAKLQPDGTIRVEDVPPGDYRLSLTYSTVPIYSRVSSPERLAFAKKQFTIPEIPGGRSDEPFDLGVLRPKPKATLKIGQAAPAFDVEGLGGKRLKLEDYRGKYLLLDFWATWCGPCIAEIPEMRSVYEKFGPDKRFAMLSLSLDAEKDAPRKFVAEKGLPWEQGFLGEWVDGGVQDAYHVESIPSVFLIGPDGTLVAEGLRGEAIGAAIAEALKAP